MNRRTSLPVASGGQARNVETPKYNRDLITPGIVHIGVGNFFRAHEAMYVDRCLHLADQNDWGIIGVGLGDGPGRLEKAETIRAQDGLYTLTEFAPDGEVEIRLIGAMIGYLHGPSETDAVLDRMASPETRIVSLTITEGGYNLDETTGAFRLDEPSVQADLTNPRSPRTAFGYIVEALAMRRAAGVAGFTVLSCDNLRSNGDVARKAVLTFAEAREAGLARWIEEHVSFPNSMVDRIAPSVGEAEVHKLQLLSGIDDETPVIGESFTQWVVQDIFVGGRPSFDLVGVELREDVDRFEMIKGRLLNASHMMLAYPALMCGHRLVDEALRQGEIRSYLEAFMDHDVIPLIEAPPGVSIDAYKGQVIERFSNPAIGDQLIRIAQNGIAKLPIFLSETLSELLERGGSFERVSLNLASFSHYLHGRDLSGGSLVVDEPLLTEADRVLIASNDPLAVLELSAFASLELASNNEFTTVFLATQQRLTKAGPEAALAFAASRADEF